MANPKRKHSQSRRDKRRANWKLSVPNVIECPECYEKRLPHTICNSCGFYNGRLRMNVVVKGE